MTVLDQLRRAIEDSKLTQAQIAQRAGISQAQVSRLMKGERGAGLETAERIAKALGKKLVLK